MQTTPPDTSRSGTQEKKRRFITSQKGEQRSLVKPSHRTHTLDNPLVFAQKLPHLRQTEVICCRFQEVLIWRSDARDYRRHWTT